MVVHRRTAPSPGTTLLFTYKPPGGMDTGKNNGKNPSGFVFTSRAAAVSYNGSFVGERCSALLLYSSGPELSRERGRSHVLDVVSRLLVIRARRYRERVPLQQADRGNLYRFAGGQRCMRVRVGRGWMSAGWELYGEMETFAGRIASNRGTGPALSIADTKVPGT